MKEYGIEQHQSNLTVKDENENEKSEVASTSQQHQTAAAASPSAPPLTSSRGEEKETKQETGTGNPAEVYTPAFTPRLSFGEDVLNLPVASAIAVDTAVMEANIAILDIEALLPQVPTGPLGMNTAAMNVEEEKEEDERVAMSA